jgi:hypothetical protein
MLLRELRSSCFVAHACRTQLFLNVFDQSDCQSFPEAVFLFLMLFLAYGYLDLSLLLLLLARGCVGNRLDRLPLSFAQQLEV